MKKRKMREKIICGICWLVLALSSLACGLMGQPDIREAWTSLDESGEEPTSVFGPEDVIYVQLKLQNSFFGDQLKAVWSTLSVPGNKPGTVISEHNLESAGPSAYFGLSNDDPWPAGDYRVDLYINGLLSATVDYSVE
jgi:hypothetical protein